MRDEKPTPEEKRRLTERRRSLHLPFDVQPLLPATLEDLDLDLSRRIYLPPAVDPDMLDEAPLGQARPVDDPNCMARLKHYRSLMPMALEVNKPMFALKPADGASGAHFQAVQQAYKDFQQVAREIARRVELVLPGTPAR